MELKKKCSYLIKKLENLDYDRIFRALAKTIGFFILSFIPVLVYVIRFSLTHQGGIFPDSYQEYAIRLLSICFPIVATRLCFEKNNSFCVFLAILFLVICVAYLFVFEQQSDSVSPILESVFRYLTFCVYGGSFVFSLMTYYNAPISEKKADDIGRNRERSADNIQNKVNW